MQPTSSPLEEEFREWLQTVPKHALKTEPPEMLVLVFLRERVFGRVEEA